MYYEFADEAHIREVYGQVAALFEDHGIGALGKGSEDSDGEEQGGGSSGTSGLHGVSPGRKRQRQEAADQMNKQANRMQSRAATKEGAVAVGSVVQIALDDVDRAKVDDHNLTCIVVELVEKGKKQSEIKYRLATQGGVLKTLYTRSYVKLLPSATPSLMGL
eukprot:1619523-Prymnesium_polylepis.1